MTTTSPRGTVSRGSRGLYDLGQPGNRFLYEQYTSTARVMLADGGFPNLYGTCVLEVGCGHGQWLCDFQAWGALEEDLAGLDLDPGKVEVARSRVPRADLRSGNAASLPWNDASFDIVVQSTLFTSVLDHAVQRAIAREMMRVLRPGGVVLWYDFVYNSPRNPNVRGIPVSNIAELFPGMLMKHRKVTLVPPLARVVAPWSPRLARALDSIHLLRTHALVTLQKSSRG